MRIKVILECEGRQVIDINYNYYLSSLIYNKLRESSKEYSTFLHETGYENGKRNYKMFTFSMLKPDKYEIQGQNFILEGKVVFYISSPMKEFLMYFVNSLTINPVVKINNGIFNVINLEAIIEPVYTNNMKFRCLSPVAVSTAYLTEKSKLKKIDLYIEDKKFAENLKSNVISKYRILNNREPQNTEFNVIFTDIEKYKRGKLINYKDNIKIKGYLAPLEISGNPELIETAYECGLGDRNSLGLGMIEVVERR